MCLHPGRRLSNNARVYMPDCMYPERTHSGVITAANQAEGSNSCVHGVFKTSPLASVLNLVESVPVDYMHCVLEGVTRWLLRAWFDTKFHSRPYYIRRCLRQIDVVLLKQRPPREFSRPPRSIAKHFKYWKASELRHWLLFYSLPILREFLPSLYWHHYALLVCAMHIMLGSSITPAQIDAAEQMLKSFCVLLPELYGEASCTANAHLLTHLAKYVRLWGPLWTHSAFGFESKNGQLKHLFHGKHNITHQLLFNLDVSYTLQQVHGQLTQCESEKTLRFIDGVAPRSNMTAIGNHAYIVGYHKIIKPTAEQSMALGSIPTVSVEAFWRLFKDGILYSSTTYAHGVSGKRDNTNCSYIDKSTGNISFGKIEIFTTTPKACALLRKLHPSHRTMLQRAGHPCRSILQTYQQVDLLNFHIIPLDKSIRSQLIAVDLDCIISKVVIVCVLGNLYCVIQPNTVEHH